MRNRYDGLLRTHNDAILSVIPGCPYVWRAMGFEVWRHYDGGKMLELGCGSGESALAVLEQVFVEEMVGSKLDLLDISPEMINSAYELLNRYLDRVNFIRGDALEYLDGATARYDVVYSSWLVHNLPWDEKRRLFAGVCAVLKPGGAFVLMDKVYPGDKQEADRLLRLQQDRYLRGFIAPEIGEAIYQHELEDYGPLYRMDEVQLREELAKHFAEVTPIDRVEREMILVCKK
jgi:ubiquinone/menaquinone biosynthesis C-methylase UbiE